MKKVYLILLLFLLSFTTFAATGSGGGVRVSPIVGIEKVYKMLPTPHLKTRTIVGARVAWGPSLLSLEAEATRAEDSEDFPNDNLKVDEESYAAKLGIRSGFNLISVVQFFLRAGGHARKTTRTIEENGVTRTEEPAIYVSPYAGTGLTFNLGGNLFGTLGYDVIFTGKPKGSDQEIQTTLAVGMRF